MTAHPSPNVDTRPVDNDDERVAHYARKSDILLAHVEGIPIQALCGKVWVPDRDPSRYPVCDVCGRELERVSAARLN